MWIIGVYKLRILLLFLARISTILSLRMLRLPMLSNLQHSLDPSEGRSKNISMPIIYEFMCTYQSFNNH